MPPDLREHVRYPELLLKLQAAVYGLYHMTEPEVFYNREDLWTVASEVGLNEQREQAAQPMEPNFVLMTLPGETKPEFIEILPFTPANRNNLIGWIAGRSDEPHYGTAHRLRLPEDAAGRRPAADRSAHRSECAAVRAAVAVEPAGLARAARHADRDSDRPRAALRRADLPAGRAQPDARAAPRRARAAGSSWRTGRRSRRRWRALRQRRVDARRPLRSQSRRPQRHRPPRRRPHGRTRRQRAVDVNALIATPPATSPTISGLTAEGKLGEAGQKLEALKQTLDELNRRR